MKCVKKVTAALTEIVARGDKYPVFPPAFIEKEYSLTFLYDQLNAFNPGTIRSVFHRLFEVVVDETDLAGFSTPTLFIAGDQDIQVPPHLIHNTARKVPGSVVHEFAGVGHAPYFQVPDQFNALVEEFISPYASQAC